MSFVITGFALPEPITTGEEATFTIRLTAYEARATRNVQEIIPRLTVYGGRLPEEGEEIRIRACSWQKAEGATGIDCSFTLADVNDREFITKSTSLTFEIGLKENGTTTYKTIASLNKLSQVAFQIAGNTFSFQTVSGVTDKLNASPAVPLMIYDPDKVPFNADEIEQLQDTEGREYEIEAIAVTGLTIYDLFQEIFVNRCGFADYWTNIPNFAVPQLSVDITETYADALNQWIEPFSAPGSDGPLLTETDDVVSIHDTSLLIPADFPTPRDLTVWGCSEAAISAAYSDVEAAKMFYSIPSTFDYTTNLMETSNLPIGDGLWRFSFTNTLEFRSFAQPLIVMDKQLQAVWEYTYRDSLANPVTQEQVTNFFDRYARLRSTLTDRWALLPDETSAPAFIGTDPTEHEEQQFTYAQHPNSLGRQYQQSITKSLTGRIMVDANNTYRGDPFRQNLRLAHWAGNAEEGFTIADGPLRNYQETVSPGRNGQVQRRITDYDMVRDLPMSQRREAQVGDVSLNGNNTITRDLIVTEDGSEFTGGKVVQFSVGPIPLDISIPLVRRKLVRLRETRASASLNIIGFDPTIEAGITFAASDLEEQIEGNFICTAFSGSAEMTREGMQCSMAVSAVEI